MAISKVTLQDLLNQVIAYRDARDWKQFHNPKDLSITLMLEAAEVLEHFQWKNPEEATQHLKDHASDIGEELVDVLYCILLLTHELNIDLEAAFTAKMIKNEAKYPIEKAKGSHAKYTTYQ